MAFKVRVLIPAPQPGLSFRGGTQGELKLTDSTTGAMLAAAVDRRIGGGAISTAAQWQWAMLKMPCGNNRNLVAARLSAWTTGAARAS